VGDGAQPHLRCATHEHADDPDARVDALSDSDVILIAQDLHPFVAERTWLNDFGHVLVGYWDPIGLDPVLGIEQRGCVTQYADRLKIDFTLWPSLCSSTLLPTLCCLPSWTLAIACCSTNII
jgi:hypothetical protein